MIYTYLKKKIIQAKQVAQDINDVFNLEIPKNKALVQSLEAILKLVEGNSYKAFISLESTINFLIAIHQNSLSDYEYDVIQSNFIDVTINLINSKNYDLAKKSIGLEKKLENKYNNFSFRKDILSEEQRLNSKIN